jgi:hypothetical protein
VSAVYRKTSIDFSQPCQVTALARALLSLRPTMQWSTVFVVALATLLALSKTSRAEPPEVRTSTISPELAPEPESFDSHPRGPQDRAEPGVRVEEVPGSSHTVKTGHGEARDDLLTADYLQRSAEIADLVRERDRIGYGGPITMISVGGSVLVAGGYLGLFAETCTECGSRPSATKAAPFFVASGLGLVGVVSGVCWLIDKRNRRLAIDHRINELGRGSGEALRIVPSFDPATRTGTVTLLRRF